MQRITLDIPPYEPPSQAFTPALYKNVQYGFIAWFDSPGNGWIVAKPTLSFKVGTSVYHGADAVSQFWTRLPENSKVTIEFVQE